jgi:hypothetical protein
MAITPLPTAPARTDAPATFVTRADAWVAALDTFTTEANAQAVAVDAVATATAADAVSTAADVVLTNADVVLADAAQAAADAASAATLWVSGTAVNTPLVQYSPTDYLSYRLKNNLTAGANTEDPAADTDNTNWVKLASAALSATVIGPLPAVDLTRTIPAIFTITNYDITSSYTITTDNGTVSRVTDTITWTPDTADAINGASFVIDGNPIDGYNVVDIDAGQQDYLTAGTYSFVVPAGITEVSVLCIGAGGNYVGFSEYNLGGGLGYKNNITVVPGASLEVIVGSGSNGTSASPSTFDAAGSGCGAEGGKHGTTTMTATQLYSSTGGDGRLEGTQSWFGGGGGAGGYSGDGGYQSTAGTDLDGAGGGGGAGGGKSLTSGVGAAGGGVGVLGEGSSGSGGDVGTRAGGQGGSGGGTGTAGQTTAGGSFGNSNGGLYGGAGAGAWHDVSVGTFVAGGGAVRIIWESTAVGATTRAWPSTNVTDL